MVFLSGGAPHLKTPCLTYPSGPFKFLMPCTGKTQMTYDARRKGGSGAEKKSKKKPFSLSQWKVLGEGVSDQNIKVFLILFCFHSHSNLLLHCQIKTPSGPLPLTEKRLFFFNYFRTTFLANVIFRTCASLMHVKTQIL